MIKNAKELKFYTIYDAKWDTGGPVLGQIEGRDEEDAIENWASRAASILGVDRCEIDEEGFVAQYIA
jgi:hypothetical protein